MRTLTLNKKSVVARATLIFLEFASRWSSSKPPVGSDSRADPGFIPTRVLSATFSMHRTTTRSKKPRGSHSSNWR
eukprot:scaffold7933_cov258-Pinguiococcus_pyrenoidosus.AAC.1